MNIKDTSLEVASTITVRYPNINFILDFNQYRLTNVYRNSFINSLHCQFPEGERFFIRSVQAYYQDIKDNIVLKERVQSFIAQEVQHGKYHENIHGILKKQNLPVDTCLKIIKFYIQIPTILFYFCTSQYQKKMNIAITAAYEHYTAVMAENYLKNIEPFEQSYNSPIEIVKLMTWHSSEEIEHKSVAFDVMQYIGTGYCTRIIALFIALLGLFFFSLITSYFMLKKDSIYKGLSKPEKKKQWLEYKNILQSLRILMRIRTKQYFHKNFHPNTIKESIDIDSILRKYKL